MSHLNIGIPRIWGYNTAGDGKLLHGLGYACIEIGNQLAAQLLRCKYKQKA